MRFHPMTTQLVTVALSSISMASVTFAGGLSFEYISGNQLTFNPEPWHVSGNGRYVIAGDGFASYMWSRADGLVLLHEAVFPPVTVGFGDPLQVGQPRAISDNGRVYVGDGKFKFNDDPDPAWTIGFALPRSAPDAEATKLYDSTLPPFQVQTAQANDVAALGNTTIVIGQLNAKPTVWHDGSPSPLNALFGPAGSGEVFRISSDANYAVGWSDDGAAGAPTRWDLQSLAPQAIGPLGFSNRATDVSADGSVVVGHAFKAGVFGSIEVWRWKDGEGFSFLGGISADFGSQNPVVSGDGSTVFCEAFDIATGNPIAAVWTTVGGMRRLDNYLTNELGIPIPDIDPMFGSGPPTLMRVNDVSTDGRTIVGLTNIGGFVADLGCADDDDDGLCNSWEINGIDINNDGTIDLPIHTWGATADHKDLFVEVDAMNSYQPWFDVGSKVETAFAGAPVSNPDGIDGIRLHFMLDEISLFALEFGAISGDVWNTYNGYKTNNYGTVIERADPNWGNIKKARRVSFRYAIFGKQIGDGGTFGLAEVFGDDLMLGFQTPTVLNTRFASENMAAIFMHEFGHNLGLLHGGDDGVNFKPNYASIMNYTFTEPNSVLGITYGLSYSFLRLADLNEAALDETIGIQGNVDPLLGARVTVWKREGPDGVGGFAAGLMDGSPLDWNGDGDASDIVTAVDLNSFDPTNSPPVFPETMRGHDDWSNVQLPVRGSFQFADFTAHTDTSDAIPDELTMADALDAIAALAGTSCAADITGDGVVDGADLAGLLAQWGTGGTADLNGSGIVDGADLAALLAAWGACS